MKKIKNNILDTSYNYNYLKKQFLSFKIAQGLANRTLKEYNKAFNIFEKYYNNNSIDIPEMVSSLLEMFSKWSNSAPATFNLPYEYLHCFFNWAVEYDYISVNPLKLTGLKKKKNVSKIKNIPTEIINKLLKSLDLKTYTGLRDYCIILLTLDTGIRPCEAFGLLLDDVQLDYQYIVITAENSKTRTKRILPLSFQTCEVIRKLMAIRIETWPEYLFLTVDGKKLSTKTWEDRMELYSNKVSYKICPYDFRHTFALLYLKNGGDVFSLKVLMGHSSISTTQLYVNFSNDDIKEQHIKKSPVNNFITRSTRVKRLNIISK